MDKKLNFPDPQFPHVWFEVTNSDAYMICCIDIWTSSTWCGVRHADDIQ